MNLGPCIGYFVVAIVCLGSSLAKAQTPEGHMPVTYECAAHAQCSISCLVDGEKDLQTGSPKSVTVTMLAPNNYLVQLVEQSGHTLFAYLAGTKVVCTFDAVTRKVGE
jgi:hypothetical protein